MTAAETETAGMAAAEMMTVEIGPMGPATAMAAKTTTETAPRMWGDRDLSVNNPG